MHRFVQRRFPIFTINLDSRGDWSRSLRKFAHTRKTRFSFDEKRRGRSSVSISVALLRRQEEAIAREKPVFRSCLRQRTWTDWTVESRRDDPLSTGENPLFFFGGSLSSRSSFHPPFGRFFAARGSSSTRRDGIALTTSNINFTLPVRRSYYHAFPPPTHPVAYQWRVPLDSRNSFVKIEYIVLEGKFCRRKPKKKRVKENFEKKFLIKLRIIKIMWEYIIII